MNWAEIRQAAWERTAPMFSGLAWSVPVAMWTALAVGDLPADTDWILASLLIPALAAVIVMMVMEKRLTWPGRIVAALLGITPLLVLVFATLPGYPFVLWLVEASMLLSWGVMLASLVLGHIAPARALADRPVAIRLLPLSVWLVITSVWVVVQASPTSAVAEEGPVLEIQMATLAGVAGLGVLLFSAVMDRIPALRQPTTRAGRLR